MLKPIRCFGRLATRGPTTTAAVGLETTCIPISVLALDPNSGKLKWYFQFTPHDTHDWDANETPVLINATFRGKPRKLLIQANRNGFYYVLDRLTGEFLLGKSFGNQNWAEGLDAKGRPILKPNMDPTPGRNLCLSGCGRQHELAVTVVRLAHRLVLCRCQRGLCALHQRGQAAKAR